MLDAELFIKELYRMCKWVHGEYPETPCVYPHCPLVKLGCYYESMAKNPTETVRIVEEWSKAHPIQTRREKFKEVFGIYPYAVNERTDEIMWTLSLNTTSWWDMPYEPPKGESK